MTRSVGLLAWRDLATRVRALAVPGIEATL
jgi:hypothetical protein